MKRRALLIGVPRGGPTDRFLPGVEIDLGSYRHFLESALGGAWERDEITTLIDPTPSSLQMAISRLQSYDYAFVTFSGHGAYNTATKSTHIVLASGQLFDSSNLRIGALKQTVVLDCCREKYTPQLAKSLESLVEASQAERQLSRTLCRQQFDQHLARCLPSTVTLNACSIDETAGDDPNSGGLYSSSLIASADMFRAGLVDPGSRHQGVLDVAHAHDEASILVKKASNQNQNPTMAGPRVRDYFPFAVVA